MRRLKIFFVVLMAMVGIYMVGPHPQQPDYSTALPAVPAGAVPLENYVRLREQAHRLKPGNEAAIVWSHPSRSKTPYALLYLHGFSASRGEGNPVHTNIARQFGCNLYLSRLSQHGIDTTEPLAHLTATNLWQSAKEALAVALQLGDSVIIMGTSTGGSLALQLAAHYPRVAGLVLMSPNIAINDANAWLLNNPWGLHIARLVKGSRFNTASNNTPQYKRFWNYQYRLEAAVELEEYVETAMVPAVFNQVKQPVLTLCYYKNQKEQDPVVKVSAMQQMMQQLGTPPYRRQLVNIPGAGHHVLGSAIVSNDVTTVERSIANFLQQAMGLIPLPAP